MFTREYSAGGIVIKLTDEDPKILLIKDSYGRWTWPKGKIEQNEKPEDAAIREIKEETGLKNLELIGRLGDIRYFFRRGKELVFKTVYLYLFRADGNEDLKILRKEIEDGMWFSFKEALAKADYKGARDIIKHAITFIK